MDDPKKSEYPLRGEALPAVMSVNMPTQFHEGVNHGHKASGKWTEVQKNPNSPDAPLLLETICKHSDHPSKLVAYARLHLWYHPLAHDHTDWYLAGTGKDFNENDALKAALQSDNVIRSAIGTELKKGGRSSGRYVNWFKLETWNYSDEGYRAAWGAIDRLDFEADYDAGTLHVWFKDRYEWHPYYPDLYDVQDGDLITSSDGLSTYVRSTNCVHAAFVEMKLPAMSESGISFSTPKGGTGAADFWMVGEATVPLSGIAK